MTIEVLRETSNQQEILTFFIELSKDKKPFKVWQSTKNTREVLDCMITEIDERNFVVSMKPINKEQTLNFEQEIEVFFRQDEIKLLFKNKISLISKKIFEFEVPAKVKIQDRRLDERKIFKTEHAKPSSMNTVICVYSDVDRAVKEFNVEVYDLSRRGMAIQVKQKVSKHFKVNKNIKLGLIGNKSNELFLEGKIAYLELIEDKKKLHQSVFLRLGIVFDEIIDLNLY